MPVDNVRRVVPLLSFLLHDSCKKASSSSPMLVIRSVAQEPDMGGGAPACAEAEPTVRVAGMEGRCVAVPNGWYHNGNQVQVWPSGRASPTVTRTSSGPSSGTAPSGPAACA